MKTPIIRYYLEPNRKKGNKRDEKEPVMVEVNYGFKKRDANGKMRNRPFRMTLLSTIMPKDFGLEKENFKFNENVFKKYSRKDKAIKIKMGQLEGAITELENHYLVNKIMPTPSEFREALKLKLDWYDIVIEDEMSILEFLYQKIQMDEEDLKIDQKKSISENTIKSYRTLSRHIENYQIVTNDVLQFSTFDETRYWNLWRVMNDIYKDKIKVDNPNQPKKQRKDEKGYNSNVIQKNQVNLLSLMRQAKKKGFKPILDLDDTRLTLEDSESMKDFYVFETELQKIINADVSHDAKLQRAKDYAIIAACTGMRFESMKDSVNEIVQQFDEEGYSFQYIHSKQNKTKTDVYIPLLKPVRDVLQRHGEKFPKVPVNQIINEDLKTLFDYLEIDEEVTITRVTYTDGTIVNKVPKSGAISTHDFKHTFYSNLYNHKVLQSAIDDITHPDRTPTNNAMAKIYNRANMLDRAKRFVDEINKINSDIYKL